MALPLRQLYALRTFFWKGSIPQRKWTNGTRSVSGISPAPKCYWHTSTKILEFTLIWRRNIQFAPSFDGELFLFGEISSMDYSRINLERGILNCSKRDKSKIPHTGFWTNSCWGYALYLLEVCFASFFLRSLNKNSAKRSASPTHRPAANEIHSG